MDHYHRIQQAYQNPDRDFTKLFQLVLAAADDIGLDAALAHLERCVIEKRLAWLDEHLPELERSDDPLADGYRIFYEEYLDISPPADGDVVDLTTERLVSQWWNPCPTLEACEALGLDTREICKKVYHKPVQVFLSRIDPRLRFDRNYAVLRPHQPWCEEIISLERVECEETAALNHPVDTPDESSKPT